MMSYLKDLLKPFVLCAGGKTFQLYEQDWSYNSSKEQY